MSIGTPTNQNSINTDLGNAVVAIRDAMLTMASKGKWLNGIGGSSGLQNQFGFSPADANSITAIIGNLTQLSNIYIGAQFTGPPLPFDFESNSTPMWGSG